VPFQSLGLTGWQSPSPKTKRLSAALLSGKLLLIQASGSTQIQDFRAHVSAADKLFAVTTQTPMRE
jgi:hypothetical protein